MMKFRLFVHNKNFFILSLGRARLFSDINGRITKKVLRDLQKNKLKSALTDGQKVAIDFELPEIMTNKDRRTLVKQVKLLYFLNMNADVPFSLSFIGLKQDSLVYSCFLQSLVNFEDLIVDCTEESIVEKFKDERIVYLTPDATEPLLSLDPKEVYILGGLVDYQIKKNTTLKKARYLNIETRRLPIPEYMERIEGRRHNYSKILAINQVFEILLKYQKTHDWKQALPVGVPARRGYVPRSDYS